MDRLQQLNHWLEQTLPGQTYQISPASADASFRRYFRVTTDNHSLIAMDAPPDKENSAPFVKVDKLLAASGIPVPELIAQDLQQGFLLLSDFGSTTLLAAVQNQQEVPKIIDLYLQAIEILIEMQVASQPNQLPPYDEALLMREMRLFDEWYIAKHVGVTLDQGQQELLNNIYQQLLSNILAQPVSYVHRDYHSRNLMVREDGSLGVLDFQDAVYGPLTYDLVSLLKDAYIRWDEELVLDLVIRYWQLAKKRGLAVAEDFAEFYRDFEWMGAQRHIKVLGVFARLYHRDGKDGYLKDMPLVMDYLRKVCERYIELNPMLKLLNQIEGKQAQVGYTF